MPKPESRYCDKLHTLFIENKHTEVKLSLHETMHDKTLIYFQPQINYTVSCKGQLLNTIYSEDKILNASASYWIMTT